MKVYWFDILLLFQLLYALGWIFPNPWAKGMVYKFSSSLVFTHTFIHIKQTYIYVYTHKNKHTDILLYKNR